MTKISLFGAALYTLRELIFAGISQIFAKIAKFNSHEDFKKLQIHKNQFISLFIAYFSEFTLKPPYPQKI